MQKEQKIKIALERQLLVLCTCSFFHWLICVTSANQEAALFIFFFSTFTTKLNTDNILTNEKQISCNTEQH